MEAKEAVHPSWGGATTPGARKTSPDVRHWSAALDGIFFEDAATTAGVTSVIVPKILLVHT
jgi:hypothetical protein